MTSKKQTNKTRAQPAARRRKTLADRLPPATDWRTTDADEILKRQLRAREERPRIVPLPDASAPALPGHDDPARRLHADFDVHSRSGLTYRVEIRDLATRQFACTCTDFRINGLRTCKHIEAALLYLKKHDKFALAAARRGALPSPRIDIVPDLAAGRLRVDRNLGKLPPRLRARFDADGLQLPDRDPADLASELTAATLPGLRVSLETAAWLKAREIDRDRILSRRDYEAGIAAGRHPEYVTLHPLFPYQREGMLHLAFTERALLADEMGLGKTIQAIAACALLHRLGKARRVLVVTPASLKAEWEEQIRRFTTLPLRLVFGRRADRVCLYTDPEPPFFTIANYEQIVADSLDLNRHLRPDIVVLDEAQRIKNWASKTAQAVKRLDSRYAFVLTGTPLENRIDELRSIVDFLNPAIFGSLFRFNRDFYTFDDKGRPAEYKNLENLRARIHPVLLRRRKADVETELPDRTDRNLFVALTPRQRDEYAEPETEAAKLASIARRRPLTPREQERLLLNLAKMRMICDTPAIIKSNPCTDCPKLDELARVLDEVLAEPDVKVILFSEWEGMLARVRAWADEHDIGYAWHTGSVPQQRRRAEIIAFREDPACRLFLSTDSGGTGLNLQNASVVINCDLPWNPARLEQRIARAWRKNQLRPVTVINLVAENTIEHGMLGTLASKQNLADGVLDGAGDLSRISLKGGGQAFLKRLEQVLAATPAADAPDCVSYNKLHTPARPSLPAADPAAAFAATLRERLGPRLLRCDETWLRPGNPAAALASVTLVAPPDASEPVLLAVVAGNAAEQKPQIETLLAGTPWRGPRPALHVLDAAAWSAIEALSAAGLLTLHARSTRPLVAPLADAAASSGAFASPPAPPPLTPEQQARLDAARALAQRKARAARALLAEDLADEAQPALRAAALAHAQAGSIDRRWPEPETLADTLRPPLDTLWTDAGRPMVDALASADGAPALDIRAATAFAADLLK
ncbi:MAG: DEAD/DEAH box helicase [Opitutaceae bacterium]|jgi:hypothetical protein|nr:DEAD/DEAH box helicase [Opitutaceae bacterium]